jgi:tRNA-specific 2-thiouridylase
MKSKKDKIKVMVAMSGGVDSSVVAALLVRSKKYDVTGAYMLNYDNNLPGSESCWLPDYRDALRVAAHLGIPLLKFDFTKEYKEKVLEYMFREYELGRTPNPDVLCNTFIKFGSWLKKARELGFDYLATGHYASVSVTKPFKLLQATDDNKDQTYFLHQLNQEQLGQIMFPIGKYTKPQVRALAKKFDLPTMNKEESMGICFIGEVPMKEFLQKRIPPKKGKIILSSGEMVGEHDGLPFYTIGERHVGAKTNDNKPLFVIDKKAETNELVVGFEDDPMVWKKETTITNVKWTSGQTPKFPLQCEVRLRHRQQLQKCRVEQVGESIAVNFSKAERAVTPGQFAVFYKKGECLGGGVIL